MGCKGPQVQILLLRPNNSIDTISLECYSVSAVDPGPSGGIGRHSRLKICRLNSVGVRVPPGAPLFRKSMMKKMDLDQVARFIQAQSPLTRVYLGCDSERVMVDGTWYADYCLAVVVHINGNNGCKLFGEVHRERDFDSRQGRPSQRLMTEVYKVSQLYLELSALIANDIDVHLDINPDENFGSSCVISEAVGYIRGTCNVIPFVKPEAFAASYAADRFKGLKAA